MTKSKSNIFSEPDMENSKLEKAKNKKYRSETFVGVSDKMEIKSDEMAHYADRDAMVDQYDKMREEIEQLEKELKQYKLEGRLEAKEEMEQKFKKYIKQLEESINIQNRVILKQRNLLIEIHKITMET